MFRMQFRALSRTVYNSFSRRSLLAKKEFSEVISEISNAFNTSITKREQYIPPPRPKIADDLTLSEGTQQKQQISEQETMRLSKYLSMNAICSRRQAEKLISQGMVYVDKKKVESNIPVTSANEIQVFTKHGEKTPMPQSSKLWLYYKPVGLICSHDDPQGRPTIYDHIKSLLKTKSHIISVGRLDFNSEGLMLITNDGSLARVMELPESKIQRQYRVRVHGRLDEKKLANIQRGAVIAGMQYGPFYCAIENRQSTNTWLIIRMTQGKNREIRKVMQKNDLRVNRIVRTHYGPYSLEGLKPGEIIETVIADQIKRKIYLMMRKSLESKQESATNINQIGTKLRGLTDKSEKFLP